MEGAGGRPRRRNCPGRDSRRLNVSGRGTRRGSPRLACGTAAPASLRSRHLPAAADGKKVYESACIACHGAGIAGAPKFGDKAAWAPRIAQGVTPFTRTRSPASPARAA